MVDAILLRPLPFQDRSLAYGDQSGVHIKLIETGETQTIPPPANLKSRGTFWFPSAWFPDGTKLLATAVEPAGLHAQHNAKRALCDAK